MTANSNIQINIARKLRRNMTDAERILWKYLRAKRFKSCKFRRQHPIGPYIADFVCIERKLVIEVDGGQHAIYVEEDQARDAWLKEKGFRVLRFWNNDVLANIEGVLETLLNIVCEESPPFGSLPTGEGKINECD